MIERYSDRQPSTYHWIDLDAKKANLLWSTRPWIDPHRMQPMQVMQFKTRDGKVLDAYLTLPAGASPTSPVPLIVLPHGGPYVRNVWGFDGEVQFLASRGYAVLQPNYRGSSGYDVSFDSADLYDFAKMAEDVNDATQTAIKTKLIDPKRMAIMGGSFGGYLALCGVTDEIMPFRCAVTIAGVFDWGEAINEAKERQYQTSQYGWLLRHLGNPGADKERFAAMSPLSRVQQVKVPVFVAHARGDMIVSVQQSRALIAALAKNSVPYESYIVSGEGHGMAHLEKQVALYSRIEAFLAKHL